MEPTKNFFRVSHEILEDPWFLSLKPIAGLLFVHLCRLRNRYQRNKTYFIRTDKQLAKDCGFSTRTLLKAKKELKEKRFIYYQSKEGRRTRYQIFEPEQWRKMFGDDHKTKKQKTKSKVTKLKDYRKFKNL